MGQLGNFKVEFQFCNDWESPENLRSRTFQWTTHKSKGFQFAVEWIFWIRANHRIKSLQNYQFVSRLLRTTFLDLKLITSVNLLCLQFKFDLSSATSLDWMRVKDNLLGVKPPLLVTIDLIIFLCIELPHIGIMQHLNWLLSCQSFWNLFSA